MIPFCRDQGIGLIPWSPLARGFLAGNRKKRGEGETVRAQVDTMAHEYYYQVHDFAVLDRVVAIAEHKGVTPAQVALAWLLHQPGLTAPIIGATKLAHLEQAIQAVDISLTAEEVAAIAEPYQPHPVLGIQVQPASNMDPR